MDVFRLTRRRYADTLSGVGAAKSGNRWNSRGVEMIYTAQSRALALAEVAVHLTLAVVPSDFVMMVIDIPESVTYDQFSFDDLPENWHIHPPIRDTQRIGDRFILDGKSAVLRVPSAVVPGDFNFLINPNHGDFKSISIRQVYDFRLDRRLFE